MTACDAAERRSKTRAPPKANGAILAPSVLHIFAVRPAAATIFEKGEDGSVNASGSVNARRRWMVAHSSRAPVSNARTGEDAPPPPPPVSRLRHTRDHAVLVLGRGSSRENQQPKQLAVGHEVYTGDGQGMSSNGSYSTAPGLAASITVRKHA